MRPTQFGVKNRQTIGQPFPNGPGGERFTKGGDHGGNNMNNSLRPSSGRPSIAFGGVGSGRPSRLGALSRNSNVPQH